MHFEEGLILFLYAETPCHAGAGEGRIVDLEIQRNQTTGWPIFHGATLKGPLRDAAPRAAWADRQKAFGWDANDREYAPNPLPSTHDFSAALAIGDAAVLAFPVASLRGTFGWITSPQAIRDFQRTVAFLPGQPPTLSQGAFDVSSFEPPVGRPTQNDPLIRWGKSSLSNVVISFGGGQGGAQSEHVVLQEIELPGSEESTVADFAGWLASVAAPAQPSLPHVRNKLVHDLLIVDDRYFDLLLKAGIHVQTRVRIDDGTGTAAASGPWDEESLPAETILYAPIFAGKPFDNSVGQGSIAASATSVLDYFAQKVTPSAPNGWRFQLGADATVGRGWLYASTWGRTTSAGSAASGAQTMGAAVQGQTAAPIPAPQGGQP